MSISLLLTKFRWHLSFAWLALALTTVGAAAAPPTTVESAATAADIEFFEAKIRPMLIDHCYACHSGQAKKLQAGLRLDSRQGMLQGGDSGQAIVPGQSAQSLLIDSVKYESFEMPPDQKLPAEDIANLERWIQMGAPWPDEATPSAAVATSEFNLQRRAQEHWAWQPLRPPALPRTRDEAWPRTDLDRFILAKLEEANMAPAPDADRSELLRRLSFDLIGLPPSLDETTSFLQDRSDNAIERLVDRLLQSPHFGERWGRHWLDLVRYAESRGHEFDDDAENAFQYRDYVIRALNTDVPYDQFVREHIAGDLLEKPRLHPTEGFNESILGTGFWFLGEWVHSPVDIRKDECDRFDNMIDVMSKTFLGVTVACARCHDHKFDAISTEDYYALSGYLQSSDFRQVRFDTIEHHRSLAQRLAELDQHYQNAIERLLVTQPIDRVDGDEPCAEAINCVVNFATVTENEFLQDGFLFGSRPRRAGEVILSATSDSPTLTFVEHTAAVNDLLWSGLSSIRQPHAQSRSELSKIPRSGRTLRTPTFELQQPELVIRVKGTGHVVACVDSHRLVAGPLHKETVRPIKAGTNWLRMQLGRYVGHRMHLEFTPAQDAPQDTQQDDNKHVGKVARTDALLEVSVVLQGPSDHDLRVIEEQEQSQAQLAQQRHAQLEELLATDTRTATELRRLTQAWAEQRQSIRASLQLSSRLAMAMLDGTGEDDHILIRGSSANPGRTVSRHFLTAIVGDRPAQIETGSGRLLLAEQINARDNPLTHRVIVNRVWHHLLGRGIVTTTDDFGVLGLPPTHPDLLDYLANRFLAEGRSLKSLIRSIVLSRTYQMSGRASLANLERDPTNQRWHYRPPKRLEGEVLRDSLLALSGRLDATPFGPSVPIHLTDFMDGRGRPKDSGPLDGNGRRSIYIAIRRNFLSPMMLTFDSPIPFSTMGRRNSSNVPAQALILMNDPFVRQQSQLWAQRGLAENAGTDSESQLIQWFYLTAFARPPTELEVPVASRFVRDRSQNVSRLECWSDFAHALINTKEFVFVR